LVVDDVVTTGATLMAAVDSLGHDRVRSAVAATVVSQPSNVTRRVTSPLARMDRVWQRF
jgi:orotate phosphoribosyltransferase-like protein